MLRVCERFKVNPAAMEAWTPAQARFFLAYDRIRRAEEARDDASRMLGGFVGGGGA